ncbi:partial protein O-GlcNAc transferase, partial [Patescibacteria group bacterium]
MQDLNTLLAQAITLHQQGQLQQAKTLYEIILSRQSQHIDALHLLGLIAKEQGEVNKAIVLITQSLHLYSNNPVAHTNLGIILHSQQRYAESIACYDQALTIDRHYAEAHYQRGNSLLALQQPEQAIMEYQIALALKLNHANIHCNLGNALLDLKDYETALKSYDMALTLRPNYAEAFSNKGIVLQELGYLEQALACYNQAIKLKPKYAKAFYNRGNLLSSRREFQTALSDYQAAIDAQPHYAKAIASQGLALQSLKRFNQAIASYDKALALNHSLDFIMGNRLFMKMNLCDWQDFDNELKQITEGIKRGEKISSPFVMQSISDSADLQKQAAILYAEKYAKQHAPLSKHQHTKIKIGYFSSDFRIHPVSQLLIDVFERHDRTRFEVIAFSFHAAKQKDATRLKLEQLFDQFLDVSQLSDTQIVQLARQLECDIAVDLNGHTEGCRTNIFALRVAPIQVSYIGYLGTMGMDCIDYLIADKILIPEHHQQHYNEKIVYLPHSFQANDSQLDISTNTPTRETLGLPEHGFVFCCFNNHYKITPTLFACWLNILQQVPNSVLWLLGDNSEAETNLRLTASKQGIA